MFAETFVSPLRSKVKEECRIHTRDDLVVGLNEVYFDENDATGHGTCEVSDMWKSGTLILFSARYSPHDRQSPSVPGIVCSAGDQLLDEGHIKPRPNICSMSTFPALSYSGGRRWGHADTR